MDLDAENFFPMGWLEKPFRRQPYPDMSYDEAIGAAMVIAWNMGTDDGSEVYAKLSHMHARMQLDHSDHDGRSAQNVAEFGMFWRGRVTTLLKWFQTSEGTK